MEASDTLSGLWACQRPGQVACARRGGRDRQGRGERGRDMKRGTLARFEVYLGLAVFAAVIALAGYGLVSALADRLDPKVRDCVERSQQTAANSGKPVTRDYAVKL